METPFSRAVTGKTRRARRLEEYKYTVHTTTTHTARWPRVLSKYFQTLLGPRPRPRPRRRVWVARTKFSACMQFLSLDEKTENYPFCVGSVIYIIIIIKSWKVWSSQLRAFLNFWKIVFDLCSDSANIRRPTNGLNIHFIFTCVRVHTIHVCKRHIHVCTYGNWQ